MKLPLALCSPQYRQRICSGGRCLTRSAAISWRRSRLLIFPSPLRIFQRLGYTDDRVKLVLNRYRRVGQLTPDSIGDALGRQVSITIANDFPEVIRSVNEGKLLVDAAPSSSVSKDIVDLAGLIHAPAAPKKKGIFALWGRG